jgi:hypothetical protein
VLRKASERKLEGIQFSLCRYFIAFLRSDKAAMEKEVSQRQAKLHAQGWFDFRPFDPSPRLARVKDEPPFK